ncbi:hypothetical protein FHR59_001705 [Xanthomonas arboricola]|uniref:STN domain-containing protein n=1 Tax=Xanthomonas TaxID=338 RepID=UPI001117623F|nr:MULTISPECIES: STN domain-containing protein [Xanthomonas]KAB0523737.1 hypothetical protein F7R02_24075 [Xanthomonas cissicola]MBB6337495.1 hypothetical protein [Xanthomonas arboricola]
MPTPFSRTLFSVAFGLAVVTTSTAAVAAQQYGTQPQRESNDRATADLRTRIGATGERIEEALRGGAITSVRATTLQRQVEQTQASMDRLSRQQGFVSAGELASYNRTLSAIDVELDRHGAARSYGNDALVASDSKDQAQSFRYDCQNEPVAIAIPGDQLDHALDQLRLTTHCPISGTDLARGKRSQPVVGTMTPTAALQAMLNGTGLQMRSIKGGFEVLRLPR